MKFWTPIKHQTDDRPPPPKDSKDIPEEKWHKVFHLANRIMRRQIKKAEDQKK